LGRIFYVKNLDFLPRFYFGLPIAGQIPAMSRIALSIQLNSFIMQHHILLSKLMRLSWEIQRKKKCIRSKALQSAWTIIQNEDITIYYLVRKHSHEKYPNKVKAKDLTLFAH